MRKSIMFLFAQVSYWSKNDKPHACGL